MKNSCKGYISSLRDKVAARSVFVIAAVLVLSCGFFAQNVLASTGDLGVTNISANQTFAIANNTYADGWKWTLDITVPTDQTTLKMKFADWVNGSSVIPAGGNIQFYSAQSTNAANEAGALSISAANNYSDVMYLGSTADLNPAVDGRQIQIVLEVKLPTNATGGSYSTSYGIDTEPNTTAPVITIIGNPIVNLTVGDSYTTDAGATAIDNVDGDLTSSIVTVNPVNTSIVGQYIITYNVTNSVAAGLIAATPVTRTVNILPSSLATLTADIAIAQGLINANASEGTTPGQHTVGALEALQSAVTTASAVTDAQPQADVDAADVVLNAAISTYNSAIVPVPDITAPVITLNGDAEMTLTVSDAYTEAGAVTDDGSIISITGSVDISVIGDYILTYSATDAAGNDATPVTRTVHVVVVPDITAPITSLETNGYIPGTWTNNDVTISVACDDGIGGSGCANTQYNIDWWDFNWYNYAGPVVISTPGMHTFFTRSTDNAGNTETCYSPENCPRVNDIYIGDAPTAGGL